METNWIIEILDAYPEHEGETDVVCTVYWRCSATDNTSDGQFFYSSCYGSMGVTLDAEEPFTPYDQLTKEQVLGWVWAGGIDKEGTEEALAAQIEEQKHQKVITKPLPW